MPNILWKSVGTPFYKDSCGLYVYKLFLDDQYVVLDDLGYCSAMRDIVGFVDFRDAKLASFPAANDSVVTKVLAVFIRGIERHH